MTFFIVLHAVICVFLVFVILLQPGKGEGAGIGFGSSSQSIFGSRGAGNFLTKTTSVCAVIFLGTSFFLTRSRMNEYNRSVIQSEASAAAAEKKPEATPAPDPKAPAAAKAPEAPAPTKKN